MDRMTQRAEFFRIFREQATQLRSYPIALDWYRIDVGHAAGVTPEEAAAWANAGYLPQEARPLIVEGFSAEMATMIADIDRDDLSPEEHAMRVLDRLYADGHIRPARPGEITASTDD